MNSKSTKSEKIIYSQAISVIIPCYNEADNIQECLDAILTTCYDAPIEIICVDGMSVDGTRNIIQEMIYQGNPIQILDNHKKFVASALNIGIDHAKYDYIARIDAHCIIASDYLTKCMEVSMEYPVENVGGKWNISGKDYMSNAIAFAMSCAFGTGTAKWRVSARAGYADTVPNGFWKKSLLKKLGGFNENLIRNQDYELNFRINESGGKIYFSPDIHMTYYTRRSIRKLWTQYFQYGEWKLEVLKLHKYSFKLRQLMAPLFVMELVIGLLISFISILCRNIYLIVLLCYFALVIFFSFKQSVQKGWKYFLIIPIVFMVLHLSYGSGFWFRVFRNLYSQFQFVTKERKIET